MSELSSPKNPVALPDPGSPFFGYGPVEEDAGGGLRGPLRRFLFFLRRLWWVPLLALLVAVVGTAVGCFFWMGPRYISQARMWETEKFNLPGGAVFTSDLQSFLGTQMELVRSLKLQQLALTHLQASGTNTIPLDKTGKPIRVELTVAPAPKSSIFVVEAACADPEFATVFLNALMNEYLDYKRNIRKVVSGDTLSSISDQVLSKEQELKSEHEALNAFQRTNNLAILQEEGSIAGTHLAKLKTQLSDLKLEAQFLEATLYEQSAGTNSDVDLVGALRGTPANATGSSAERLTPFQQVQLLKLQRERLSKHLRPKHPKIARLDADIERSQQLIDLYHRQSRDRLVAERQAVKMRIDSVVDSIREWESRVTEANIRIAEAERLKLNVARVQSEYDQLMTLQQNVTITRKIDQETVAVLEQASPALRSYKREGIALATAVFCGLFFGAGIILFVGIRDDRFTSLNEVAEQLGVQILGQVPDMGEAPEEAPIGLIESNDPRHLYVEAYRSLRSALLFQSIGGQRPKVFLMTSAQPSEGKSTIAANLARTLALAGSRVLLIDGDLRRGRLHRLLGVDANPGLSEFLGRQADLRTVLKATSMANLSFIARGRHSAHAGDLFLGPDMDNLLAVAREKFDYVVIDCCPVMVADDATTLAAMVDAALFVVRNRYACGPVVREALELLNQRQAIVGGVIFNRAQTPSRPYYRYQYAEYYEGEKSEKSTG